MALLLQHLSLKLGIITQHSLADACRLALPAYLNIPLYILCELAIIACDIAEVIGSAIALNLLFGCGVEVGVVLTSLDVFVVLFGWSEGGMRVFEAGIMALFFGIAGCFAALLYQTSPDWLKVVQGFVPGGQIFASEKALYIAMGIVGSTVMPHNLYLHSSIVRHRANPRISAFGDISIQTEEDVSSITANESDSLDDAPTQQDIEPSPVKFWNKKNMDQMITLTALDSIIALTLALFINAAILTVSAAAFWDADKISPVSDLGDAYRLISSSISPTAGLLFAVALLFAGQSSTITGTLAGQICMEGFLGPGMARYITPVTRRLLTRIIAIVPAVVVASIAGEKGIGELLVLSQLPFAMWPLILFTSGCVSGVSMRVVLDTSESELREDGGEAVGLLGEARSVDYSNSWLMNVAACVVATLITGFNFVLLYQVYNGID